MFDAYFKGEMQYAMTEKLEWELCRLDWAKLAVNC